MDLEITEVFCFGWVDSVIKKLDTESNVQRITPRRKKKTFLSELDRQRIWKLQHLGQMTAADIQPIADQIGAPKEGLEILDWILQQIQADPDIWENFQQFDHFYQRLKISWITDCLPYRKEEAQKRLDYFLKNTQKGMLYGTIPLAGIRL